MNLTANKNETLDMIFREIQEKSSRLVGIASNPILVYFDRAICDKIDAMAPCDPVVSKYQQDIISDIRSWKDDFCESHKTALEKFHEASLYVVLKCNGIAVSRIPERATEKTPDFSVNAKDGCFYIEQKSLGFAQDKNNYSGAMLASIDSNIDIESQLQTKKIAHAEHIIAPYGGVKGYDCSSRKMVMRVLEEKIEQNLKPDQFSKGPTLLFVNINQLPIIGDGRQSVCAVFVSSNKEAEIVSGILWHVCFGKIGDRIFSNAEFEGRPSIEGELEREGVLVRKDFIHAVVFWKNEGLQYEFYCLHKDKNELPSDIYKIMTSENDENNSQAYKYSTVNVCA
ncbi:MAG: hypothetical protein IPO40_17885 [Fibrobacteres bacterium]|nr:hypothetical protein [Fibrobacterota bacterium]